MENSQTIEFVSHKHHIIFLARVLFVLIIIQRTLVITTVFDTKDFAVKIEFDIINKLDMTHLKHQ